MTASSYRERTFLCPYGLQLYYRDYPGPAEGGTPVLCLGGLTRNSKDFAGLARHLARKRRVICPDYRGRGRSTYDPDWRRYHPRIYLEDVRHLLAATGIHAVVVIGTSLGGILAAALAVALPTALRGAVINDVGPVVEKSGLDRIIAYLRDDPPLPDMDTAIAHLRKWLPDLPAQDRGGWEAIANCTYRQNDDGSYRRDWDPALVKPLLESDGSETDLWPLFRALRNVPGVLVRGAESDILTAETAQQVDAALPKARLVTIADVGHAPSLGEPAALAAIDELLDHVDA